MMHTFRLLHMAKEIAEEGIINVKRSDRAFLLDIKNGKFEYDELVSWAASKKEALETLYLNSKLPEYPNSIEINKLLITIREEFYQ